MDLFSMLEDLNIASRPFVPLLVIVFFIILVLLLNEREKYLKIGYEKDSENKKSNIIDSDVKNLIFLIALIAIFVLITRVTNKYWISALGMIIILVLIKKKNQKIKIELMDEGIDVDQFKKQEVIDENSNNTNNAKRMTNLEVFGLIVLTFIVATAPFWIVLLAIAQIASTSG